MWQFRVLSASYRNRTHRLLGSARSYGGLTQASPVVRTSCMTLLGIRGLSLEIEMAVVMGGAHLKNSLSGKVRRDGGEPPCAPFHRFRGWQSSQRFRRRVPSS
jgi:hypothetical protein